ncbi:hypothetical protein G9A89_022595 [Geosiphon pyriformis]|nr:hypothetical protein G9A89_022595 [Geosiphon pyriformis]
MHVCHNCVPNSKLLSKSQSKPISKYLPANNAATNLLTASISNPSLSTAATGNLSIAVPNNLSAAAPNNLLVSTINSNTTPKLSYDDIRKPETQNCSKLEIGDGCSSTDPQFLSPKLRILLLVTPEDITSSNLESDQPITLTNNILPAIVTNDKSLAAIFSFELEGPSRLLLFSGAILEEKPITVMYTDAKVDGHLIKLILDSVDRAASAHIITADGATKTPIGEIDDFSFEVNSIITPIKVLVIEATQYQALVGKWDGTLCLACEDTLLDKGMWKNIPGRGGACDKTCQYTILINDWVRKGIPIDNTWKRALRRLEGYPHDKNEIWRMAYAMSEGATTEELRKIKDNPLLLSEPEYVQMFDVFGNVEENPEEFYEHYQ